MKYTTNPANGAVMTIDDLATFVDEMKNLRNLPGDTLVRATGSVHNMDMSNGTLISKLTADEEALPPNRQVRRSAGQRGPKGGAR